MTDNYTHATVRSIFIIWVNGGVQWKTEKGCVSPNEWIPAFTKACDPIVERSLYMEGGDTATSTRYVNCINANAILPTCPKCAVLYDMAREAWDEEEQRRKLLTPEPESGTTPPCLP